MAKEFSGDKHLPFRTVSELIADGRKLPKLEALKWPKGQGARQTAYLCYSSGTSGLPVSKPKAISRNGEHSRVGEAGLIEQEARQLIIPPERCHDQPQKCYRKHHADFDL